MAKSKVTIFSKPEEIDGIMKTKINQFQRKGGKGGKLVRWTEEEIELRNAVVMDYIKQGLSREDTARQLSERWDVKMNAARGYVSNAIKDFTKLYTAEDQEEVKKVFMERCETILQMSLEDNDKASAMKAIDLMGKATGIYTEKKQIEANVETNITFDFS